MIQHQLFRTHAFGKGACHLRGRMAAGDDSLPHRAGALVRKVRVRGLVHHEAGVKGEACQRRCITCVAENDYLATAEDRLALAVARNGRRDDAGVRHARASAAASSAARAVLVVRLSRRAPHLGTRKLERAGRRVRIEDARPARDAVRPLSEYVPNTRHWMAVSAACGSCAAQRRTRVQDRARAELDFAAERELELAPQPRAIARNVAPGHLARLEELARRARGPRVVVEQQLVYGVPPARDGLAAPQRAEAGAQEASQARGADERHVRRAGRVLPGCGRVRCARERCGSQHAPARLARGRGRVARRLRP